MLALLHKKVVRCRLCITMPEGSKSRCSFHAPVQLVLVGTSTFLQLPLPPDACTVVQGLALQQP
jgi:hypothetical protein